MDPIELYSTVVAVMAAALLLVTAGMAKKRLVWNPKPLPRLRRRRR
jgi:hypothetical protein